MIPLSLQKRMAGLLVALAGTTATAAAATLERSAIPVRASVCSTSVLDGSRQWKQSRVTVFFADEASLSAERMVPYEYRGFNEHQEMTVRVRCRIPATQAAIDTMNRAMEVSPSSSQPRRALGARSETSIGDVVTNDIPLEPIEVIACGPGTTGDYPFCIPDEPVDLLPGGGGGPTEPPGGGGGGGGQPPEPPDEDDEDDEPEPCETNNPVLNSQGVQDGLERLWSKSNADANLAQRREQAGWIVQKADGSYYVHIWRIQNTFGAIGGCDGLTPAELQSTMPNEGAGAIVAFVHSHPYTPGEWIPDLCQNGQLDDYDGTESDFDRDALAGISNFLNRDIPGMVIDQERVTQFSGATDRQSWDRCGY